MEDTHNDEVGARYRITRDHAHLFEPGIARCNCNPTSSQMDDQPMEDEEYEAYEEYEETEREPEKTECHERKYEEPHGVDDRCICAFDRSTEDAWPCFLEKDWRNEMCHSCTAAAVCTLKANVSKTVNPIHPKFPCQCNPTNFCIAFQTDVKPVQIWEWLAGVKPTEDPNFLKAMGFEGMNDEVAIVTKAKENIMFVMSTLSMTERERLSTSKKELIQKCSFNGQACDIENDFLTQIDPIFGNCFTFNHDRTLNMTSLRAGPMYGLRILVYVNASDYMPTTEATGIRMTIHDKDEFPFPDTFGYSAPTGYVSSFGLRMRKMSRLPAPYGDCIMGGKTQDYVYSNYSYSVEGCFRSCFQKNVLKQCRCGDPRFPVPEGSPFAHCEATDVKQRDCLNRAMIQLGDVQNSLQCICQQPCEQSVYSVTYSPAKWPSQSLQIQLGSCNGTAIECNKHYKENGAMIEVFYEQLNYEMLTESEAYGQSLDATNKMNYGAKSSTMIEHPKKKRRKHKFVNLLADFGGQLGLWCGISFLTCCEFVFLFLETTWMSAEHNYAIWKRKREEKQKRLLS